MQTMEVLETHSMGLNCSVDDNGTEDGTKPLVVNVGSASGSFTSTGSGHDHGIDQIVGLDRLDMNIFLLGVMDKIRMTEDK